ncbi:glycosyltransferase family 4 protein [Neobacillus sp. WH10]|uniref:glycosyltransferase family 4 protein n=1 Tax=Neobacillus sp. WH10 TaxID=3047873 RepID=UPI0024C1CC6C|nr:glycosyltransferase family 4 protein [Neobacillus sp. WH10]WHY76644.1 glycosyltransferase family 4 protein [Neobacillus sp. WH10]
MKVLVISSDTKSLIDFRSELMIEIINQGNEVVAVAPENIFLEEFEKIGVKFCQISFHRTSKNPFNDLKYYINLLKVIKKENPDIIFSYHMKPVIYGSMAGNKSNVKCIYSLFPGLGYTFSKIDNPSLKDKLLQKIIIWLLKHACKHNNLVFVQNPDDRQELIENRIIPEDKCVRVNSSGVDLNKYTPVKLPAKPVFIMAARLLKDKGVFEYINAANHVKQKYNHVEFLLLGPIDLNPNSINEQELNELLSDGCVKYLGHVNDVRPYISQASIFVLPSYYREGVPRSIQEAMAMGRAIITTDSIGCRETVKHGYNGLLTRPKDTDDLINNMEYLIQNPGEISRMGENSIKYCKEKFDVKHVNKQMLSAMGIYDITNEKKQLLASR